MKPIVNLKETEVFQHSSGLQEKQISKEMLEKNPAKYVHTHPTLYANAEAIKREMALKASATKIGSNTRFINANVSDAKTVVLVGSGKPKTLNKGKREMMIQDALKRMQAKGQSTAKEQAKAKVATNKPTKASSKRTTDTPKSNIGGDKIAE